MQGGEKVSEFPNLESMSDLELVVLQHKLEKYPEDRIHRVAVLKELGRRAKK